MPRISKAEISSNRSKMIFSIRPNACAQTAQSDAIRAWLPREIEVSSPHPVFASSSGGGVWGGFFCIRGKLAIGDSLAFGHPVEPHDRCGADYTNFEVLVGKRQICRFSIGGVGDKDCLVLDPAIGVAVAELRRAERVERFGVGR